MLLSIISRELVVLVYRLTHWSVIARNLVVRPTTLNIKRKSFSQEYI